MLEWTSYVNIVPVDFPCNGCEPFLRQFDIACMSKIQTILILSIIVEIPKVKVNMRFFFLSVYLYENQHFGDQI
jgi:hypothetical protein